MQILMLKNCENFLQHFFVLCFVLKFIKVISCFFFPLFLSDTLSKQLTIICKEWKTEQNLVTGFR